jgi:hypothetical protein
MTRLSVHRTRSRWSASNIAQKGLRSSGRLAEIWRGGGQLRLAVDAWQLSLLMSQNTRRCPVDQLEQRVEPNHRDCNASL